MSDSRAGQLFNRLTKIKESIQRKSTSPEGERSCNPGHESTDASLTTPVSEVDDALPSEPVTIGPAMPRETGDIIPKKEGTKRDTDQDLDGLLNRLNDLAPDLLKRESPNYPQIARGHSPNGGSTKSSSDPTRTGGATGAVSHASERSCDFFPEQPTSFHDAGLNDGIVEELVLKVLLASGESTGSKVAEQVQLPYPLIADFLNKLKYDQLVQYRGTTTINDYICTLTDLGRERARRHSMRCTYFGSAPVTITQYRESVERQSLRHQHPCADDLKRAFCDLLIDYRMMVRLGAAMNSGRGMFLYGSPGNGKTSIAERVTKAFGEYIWIPRAVGIDGEIIRVFDPSQHIEAPLDEGTDVVKRNKVDTRWVRVRRPTIIVGGELTMDNLELSVNHATGINEAPVQMKSNCGTLVIDDFGRQRMSVTELLNRWIVPLEKRVDFLNMPSGKKIEVPFDQLVVFSTNLEPRELVDDAFLRRIPYKINIDDPSEAAFRQLFEILCPQMGFDYDDAAITYLIQTHYTPNQRSFRCCHPRDLLLQIQNFCRYTRQPLTLTHTNFDFAANNYFSIM